jgi:hypothetical protein
MITVQNKRKNNLNRWPSQNTFGMCTLLHWTQSLRTQFSMSINVWRLVGDTLNITCNFLYCNHQVHKNFLITLYMPHAVWRFHIVMVCLVNIRKLFFKQFVVIYGFWMFHYLSAPNKKLNTDCAFHQIFYKLRTLHDCHISISDIRKL